VHDDDIGKAAHGIFGRAREAPNPRDRSPRVCQMACLNVMFDTCSLDWIVKRRPEARKVRDAIVAGRIRGFYCETLVTLEGVQKKERREVLVDRL
jgi:hypothetical protein